METRCRSHWHSSATLRPWPDRLALARRWRFNEPVLRFLRTPRGAIALSLVLVIAFLFINLGLWQLRRADARALENQVMSERLAADPIPMRDLLAAVGDDLESLEYRRVTVEGEYRPELELLIRNMTNLGQAGFHVITPLETESGYVLVNRGWVPLVMDTPPVAASPPEGDVTVAGVVRLTQLRPSVGPIEPDGVLTVASRVDIDRLAQQIPGEVTPVWVQSTDEVAESLPVPVEVPSFDDPGPHVMYAIQWFSFTLIGVVGFFFLVRNQSGRARRRRVEAPV